MFCSSFSRILPDGFVQIQLYAGLSGPLFFVFLTQAGHFVATALLRVTKYTLVHVSMRLGDPFDTTENVSLFLYLLIYIITLRSHIHLHHHSQRDVTEIVSKIIPNLGFVF